MNTYKINNMLIGDIILRQGLYTPIKITTSDLDGLRQLKYASTESAYALKIDGFCPKCNNTTTFIRVPNEQDEEHTRQPTRISLNYANTPVTVDQQKKLELDYQTFITKYNFINISFKCSRNEVHKMQVSFYLDKYSSTLMKIGQYPSYSDLNNEELDEYKKELGDYYNEYVKSIRLFGSGIGCGSYVYLRRIFEYLIEKIHLEVKEKEKWDSNTNAMYSKSEIKDKIKMLKNDLPQFLVDNRLQIYSILSKGMHELTEHECVRYYPILKRTILFILEEEHSRRIKQKLEKDLSRELNIIHSDLKGND